MCRMSGLEKPRIMCWPASRARKIWTSSRATGLNALAVRLGAIRLRVVSPSCGFDRRDQFLRKLTLFSRQKQLVWIDPERRGDLRQFLQSDILFTSFDAA